MADVFLEVLHGQVKAGAVHVFVFEDFLALHPGQIEKFLVTFCDGLNIFLLSCILLLYASLMVKLKELNIAVMQFASFKAYTVITLEYRHVGSFRIYDMS